MKRAVTIFGKMRCSKCGCELPEELAEALVAAGKGPICGSCWTKGVWEYFEENAILTELVGGRIK